MSKALIKFWHFKLGQESAEGSLHSERPSTNRKLEDVECVQAAIKGKLTMQ